VERKALSIIANGGAGIKTFADANGVMLEVLVDSINEKAADYIGDNIMVINGSITIYDEYMAKIERMTEMADAADVADVADVATILKTRSEQ
jgi:hypothetical protein